jgi:hypothetical protein
MVRFDPQARRVEWIRYDYPIAEVQAKIRAAKLPAYLADRLEAGR